MILAALFGIVASPTWAATTATAWATKVEHYSRSSSSRLVASGVQMHRQYVSHNLLGLLPAIDVVLVALSSKAISCFYSVAVGNSNHAYPSTRIEGNDSTSL